MDSGGVAANVITFADISLAPTLLRARLTMGFTDARDNEREASGFGHSSRRLELLLCLCM